MRFGGATLFAASVLVASTAVADRQNALNSGYFARVDAITAQLLAEPGFYAALAERNEGASKADAKAKSEAWRDPESDVFKGVMRSDATNMLRRIVDESGGELSQILVLDKVGGVFAVWPRTSEYWHGEQVRFKQTMLEGPDARYVGVVTRAVDAGAWIEVPGPVGRCDEAVCWVWKPQDTWHQQLTKTISVRGHAVGAIAVGFDIAYSPKRGK